MAACLSVIIVWMVYTCWAGYVCATTGTWKPEDNSMESLLSFHSLAQQAPLSDEPPHLPQKMLSENKNCGKSLQSLSLESALSRSSCNRGVPKAVLGCLINSDGSQKAMSLSRVLRGSNNSILLVIFRCYIEAGAV